ncbi:DUF885 domain-containing protein [Chitinimonas sp. BJB300]|uniref:DUF885 domain-containing protein n=1 Tax=Chitinimonas sp. BJB300 TaxID=1559339 RepID=UPI000C0CAC47|nr:DUF885 domain-containing protein [Chitinimonas sp. BJB300]PHV10237.1 DUF885 domain-containing protein [Chitinimonas sp. BJB300]TSJ87557.1 DUF885 domain-containing protein [Chitinimonas sp. BJB300]
MRLKHLAIGGAVVAALSTVALANTLFFRPWSIGVFFERVAFEDLLESPQTLSDLRLFEPWGIRRHNALLDDASDARFERQQARIRQNLTTLLAYDRTGLTPSQQLSYDTLRWALEQRMAGASFKLHNYPVNQIWGEQLNLINFLVSTHQVNDVRDADDYLARLRAVPAKLAQVKEAQAHRAAQGIVAPHFALQKAIDGMHAFLAMPAEQNPLYTSFANKLKHTKLRDIDQNKLLAGVKDMLDTQVYPAYQQLADATEALAKTHPRNDGVWALPNGSAYYAWALRGHLTTNLSPDAVHQLGLMEVARIQNEMRTILQATGHPNEDVGQAMMQLNDDPRFLYPDTDAGRAQVITDYKAILAEAHTLLPKAFGKLPAATLDVQPVPKLGEKTAAGAYYEAAALDGSRPGVFFANLYDIKSSSRWNMRTLAYHEGLPGHHLQTAVAREQTDLPSFRRFTWYTAYREGWALYAEKLADEMGLEPDPYDKLGRLRAELFRAVRLVVDTGMHAKRWTREAAVDYMVKTTGMSEGDSVVEIERYLVDPGQACAYKIGMLKILELRERAKQKLGPQFDQRIFHDLVLRNGPLPLDLLERGVNEWVAHGGKPLAS